MESKKLTAERGANYGHPLDNFERMALVEKLVADCPDGVVRQALYMIGVKITRLVHKPDHQDSIDDIQGYAETINMVHKERAERHITPEFSQSYTVKPEEQIKSERERLVESVKRQYEMHKQGQKDGRAADGNIPGNYDQRERYKKGEEDTDA